MKISPNVYIVDGVVQPSKGWKYLQPSPKRTTTKFHHARYSIYKPALIIDGKKLTLFDTGTPESLPRFKECVEGLGFQLKDIVNIIISHAHADHLGIMKQLVDISGARVFAHQEEAPYVEKKILGSRDFEAVKVDVHLKDGDVLDVLGGLKVIYTPGHTPGHISLYCPKEKMLFAADLFRYSQGTFHLCPPQYSVDYVAVVSSMVKVAQYDFDTAVLYHGEPIIGGASDKYRAYLDYLKAISDIFLPSIKETLAPEMEI